MQHRTPRFKRSAAILTVAVALTATAACSGRSSDDNGPDKDKSSAFATPPKAKGPVDSVTWATRAEPTSLDSAVAFGGDVLAPLANVCEGLVQSKSDGTTGPLLAEKISQPDDKTYVFTLRDDVKFFDGTPMTAADVVFSLKRTIDPKSGSFFGSYAKNVTSVEATGDNEVTVKLSQADPVFFQMLGTPLGHVVEKAYVEKAGAKYGSADSLPMCTGPYKVASWKRGESLNLTANDTWWKGSDQLTRTAKFVFVADDATLAAGLTSGDIDGTFVASPSSMGALAKASDVKVYSGPSGTFDHLIVAHKGGIMDTPGIREAVQKTIDYANTSKVLFNGYAEPMNAVAPKGAWGAESTIYQKASDALPPAKQDLGAAKALLKKSGVSNPKIVLGVPSFLPDFQAFAESLKSTAAKAGLDLELKLLPKADFYALYSDPAARAKIDMFYTQSLAYVPDPTEVYTAMATPGGSENFNGYDNPKVTSLLSDAASTNDAAARADLVVKAQAIIMQDLPWIPVAYEYQTLPLNKRLAGTPVASPNVFYTAWLPQTGSAS